MEELIVYIMKDLESVALGLNVYYVMQTQKYYSENANNFTYAGLLSQQHVYFNLWKNCICNFICICISIQIWRMPDLKRNMTVDYNQYFTKKNIDSKQQIFFIN